MTLTSDPDDPALTHGIDAADPVRWQLNVDCAAWADTP